MTANDGRWEKLLSHEAAQGFAGELLGTFILVFFGIGSVAVTVLFSAHSGLLQVALMWGIGVSLAIYCTRHLSCAHLNPAVSLAMVVAGRMSAGNCLTTGWPRCWELSQPACLSTGSSPALLQALSLSTI